MKINTSSAPTRPARRAGFQGLLTERGADAEGLDDFQGDWQRTVAKLDGHVSRFVRRERAADDAAVANSSFDPRRTDDHVVDRDGEDLVEVTGGVGLEAIGGVGLQVELDHGGAQRVEADAGVPQVTSPEHGLRGIGREQGSLVDEVEPGVDDQQLAGLAKEADGFFRVLDAGLFDDEAVVAFDLNERLGHAERVDPVLDDALDGIHVAVLQLLLRRRVGLEAHMQAALQVQALAEAQVGQIAAGYLDRQAGRAGQRHVEGEAEDDGDESERGPLASAHGLSDLPGNQR